MWFPPLSQNADFLALDVETANSDFASICQIGIAGFYSGEVVYEASALVNPEDWFDPMNISVHGIQEEQVLASPTFKTLSNSLNELLVGKTCVIHTQFDRSAISQACVKYRALPPQCYWLDSATVARRTWSAVSKSGYGLRSLADMLGIHFRHHDALEDAKAAGLVLCHAMKESGLTVDEWHKRVKQPITGRYPDDVKYDGNPDGPLYGEVLVFTGEMSIPRSQAAQMAADLGCAVKPSVTKQVTILVVGDQDVTKLAGHQISSKHRRAHELMSDGGPIRIIRETDFVALMESVKP